jgi:hypothetical protein
MPVEFDSPEEQRRPWATWLLSAAIICASLVAFPNLREVVQRFGLIPVQATRLDGLTFVTSFFLHAGIIHLAGNMYFLLAFGHAVENFRDHCVISRSLHWQHSSATWRISLLILVRRRLASAPAAALPASSRFTH